MDKDSTARFVAVLNDVSRAYAGTSAGALSRETGLYGLHFVPLVQICFVETTGFPSRYFRKRAALVKSSPLHLSSVRSKSRNVAPIKDLLAHLPSTISAPLKNTRHPYPEPRRVVFVVNMSTLQ
jgi:hypothetical protein